MRTTEGTVLSGADLAAFRAEKARIDRMVSGQAQPTALAEADTDGDKAPLRR